MNDSIEIVTVDASNVDARGFFCYKSKLNAPGYGNKLKWLRKQFAAGLKIMMLYENGRSVGFIEYVPWEHSWRVVEAPNCLVVHCLWVVGRGKKKGYGSQLIQACLEDARRQRKQGVVMIGSKGW